jgi:hypothetical protein
MAKSNANLFVYKPDHPRANERGYVRKYRLVMEAKLGRYLTADEVVHHIDGNRENFDISNLKLFKNKAAHISYEDSIRDE